MCHHLVPCDNFYFDSYWTKHRVSTEEADGHQIQSCSELSRILVFHPWRYRWEKKNNHAGAQQVQNNDNGKAKDESSQPLWPCEPCSPWETPDPSCEPSQLLCRWKVNLLQMSWHRPKIPRSPATSYGACANELPIVHLWQLPVLRKKISMHLMGMKPKVA